MTCIKADRKNFSHKMVQFYCRWRGKFEIENSSRSWLQRSGAVYLGAATPLCSNVAAGCR